MKANHPHHEAPMVSPDWLQRRAAGVGIDAARVLIVGAGGLGSPVALGLAAAGVGTLILVDPDTVELSNLNRQLLHCSSVIGVKKVVSAAARLRRLYPAVRVEIHAERLDEGNVEHHFSRADFLID